jgi:hypothetical protein
MLVEQVAPDFDIAKAIQANQACNEIDESRRT